MKKEDIELITRNLSEQLEYYCEDSSDDEFSESIKDDTKDDEKILKEIYDILNKEKRFDLSRYIKEKLKQ